MYGLIVWLGSVWLCWVLYIWGLGCVLGHGCVGVLKRLFRDSLATIIIISLNIVNVFSINITVNKTNLKKS